MLTLREDGLEKVRAGLTSVEEVLACRQPERHFWVSRAVTRRTIGNGHGSRC